MRRKRKTTLKDHSPSSGAARPAAPRTQGSAPRHRVSNPPVDAARRSPAPAPVKPKVREPPAPAPVKPDVREPPTPAPVKPEVREAPAPAPIEAAVNQPMSTAPSIRATATLAPTKPATPVGASVKPEVREPPTPAPTKAAVTQPAKPAPSTRASANIAPTKSAAPIKPAAPIAAAKLTKSAIPTKPTKPIVPVKLPLAPDPPTVEVLRPEDLISLSVSFTNLKLDTSVPRSPKLVIQDGSKPAYLVFIFAPQSILEQAYFETATITTNPPYDSGAPALPGTPDVLADPGDVPAYLAGQSRLVFQVPSSVKEIPYTVQGLLDWSALKLVVSPFALGKPLPAPITEPTYFETAIELPWRIVLSPQSDVGWAHAKVPETFAGRTALWHTRLSTVNKVKSGSQTTLTLEEASDSNTVPLRAIWSDDFSDHAALPPFGQEVPFRSSLDPYDRMQIVILTTGTLGYYVTSSNVTGLASPYTPLPIQASRLFLSALGGYLSSRGSWQILPSYIYTLDGEQHTQSLDLTEWVHQATLGRDQYVRVVYAGYMYPFGHAASLIKVTERKIESPDGTATTPASAYLRQHMYIVVREPKKNYESQPYEFQKREMPFWKNVQIKTVVTPDIDVPQPLIGAVANSFWVKVGGENFNFHIVATDLAGNTINFLAPLVFMSDVESNVTGLQSAYAGDDTDRVCTLKGQKIAYASPSAGDTTLRTTELYFTTEILIPEPPFTLAPFIPSLDKAVVTVPAIEEILGTATPLTINLYRSYLQNGLDSNAGVYAELVATAQTPIPLISFSAGQSGGFSTPSLTLTALSARKGLVAGQASDAAAGKINPQEFFDISAKLFGIVPLQILVPVGSDNLADAAQNAPEIRTVLKPNSKNPTTSVTTIKWSPQLKSNSQIIFTSGSVLNLTAELTRNLAGGPPTSQINGQLTNFAVSLFGIVVLNLTSLKFSSQNGQKMNVVAKLPSTGAIQFQGALGFIQALATALPPGIFGGKGPSIDLEPTQISVSFTLGLPPLSIGVFSLENISITTGLDLPYLDGIPSFEFAFAKRSSPFLLTVECLGGGGFFHLVVNATGVQMVEGQLEFGGEFSIDLGVASGSVHAMAGIYFKLTGTSSDLSGFVDIGGEVSVLGIISVSIDLNLSLSWIQSGSGSKVQGRATMTISVSVLFFSVSVSISIERSFGSGPGDPRIDQIISPQEWSEYAAAFA